MPTLYAADNNINLIYKMHSPNQNAAVLQSFEQLHPRAVSVVIDPIQSVKGKVVIDAFRSNPSDPKD